MSGASPVVIVGASGSIGGHLLNAAGAIAPALGTYFTSPVPGAVRLDAGDPDAVSQLLDRAAPAAVVVCAALTDPDRCEQDPELSRHANVMVAAVLAKACAARAIKIVYLSTDYVFDGLSGPYRESDPTRPVNVYGRDKAHGEEIVLASDPTAIVIRTSVVYGGSLPGAVDKVRHYLSQGRSLALSQQHRNTPTWAADLAWLLHQVLASGGAGVYHAAGPQTMTRFELGVAVARACGFPVRLIEPLDPAARSVAARPTSCGLLIERAQADFGYRPAALSEYLARVG